MLRVTLLAVAVSVATVSHAETTSFKEQLAKEQIAKATEAARKKLPPVDREALKKCPGRDAPEPNTGAELAAQAACYRAAGQLGKAIMCWDRVRYRFPRSHEDKEAVLQLGPAYEAAGAFDRAATWYSTPTSTTFAPEPRDSDRLIRAICIWRQLGWAKEATRGFESLSRIDRKRRFDSDTLCDSIRPIVPPAS